jgi:hypothetical protein
VSALIGVPLGASDAEEMPVDGEASDAADVPETTACLTVPGRIFEDVPPRIECH